MKRLLPFLFLLPFSAQSQWSAAQTQKLDSLLDIYAKHQRLRGQVALYKNGQALYQRNVESAPGAGYSDSVYRIGSITKTFTAAMIFKTIEAGKLTLDTRLSQFYPDFPGADSITIDRLLSHQSGLHNVTDDSVYSSYEQTAQTQAQMEARFAAGGQDFKPGTKSEYSNTNYILLGYILEKVNKKSYAKLLEQWITKPLGLKNTRIFESGRTQPAEVVSYNWNDGWATATNTHPSIPGAAGAMVSTTADLNRFITALMEGKLISAGSLANMQKLTRNYGRGIFRMPFYSQFGWGHTGGIDGFRSSVAYLPGDSLVMVYLLNGTRMDPNELAIGLLSVHYQRPYQLPSYSTYEAGGAELDGYVGTYASDDIPLKITIARKGNSLTGQATGQPSFPLDVKEKGVYVFDPAGVVIRFMEGGKELMLEQGGGSFTFRKEAK